MVYNSNEIAAEARKALLRSTETPQEHFARLVRLGWINAKGDITWVMGGEAEPEADAEIERPYHPVPNGRISLESKPNGRNGNGADRRSS